MPSESELRQLLDLARSGDRDALGQLLDHFRSELRDMARHRITERLRVRVDESDLIQKSCLSAFRDFAQFVGEAPDEFGAWLRQIHDRNITDTIRDHAAYQKRAVSREASDEDAILHSCARMPSPCEQVIQQETADEVRAAVDELPEAYREAVRLRHLEACSLAEIAQRLGRSEDAVAGLIRRGLRKLRGQLKGLRG
jgi:RNA polymerase sigma-70 factor (ECF subfamily)